MEAKKGVRGSPSSEAIFQEWSSKRESPSVSQSQSQWGQLKATKVKEKVLMAAIENLGGGEKGLQATAKLVMCWMNEQILWNSNDPSSVDHLPTGNVSDIHSSNFTSLSNWNDPFVAAQPDISNVDQLEQLDSGSESHVSLGLAGSINSQPSTCNDGGNWHALQSCVKESQKFTGQSAMLGQVGKDLLGLGRQGLVPSLLPRLISRKRSLSLENTGQQGCASEMAHGLQRRIRSLPSSPLPSSCCAPLGFTPSTKSASLEMNAYNRLGMQPHTDMIDRKLSAEGAFHGSGVIERLGCAGSSNPASQETTLDGQLSGVLPELVGNSEATPSSSTRLARNSRMVDRKGKAASHSKCLSSAVGLSAGTGSIALTSFLQRLMRSEGSSTVDGQALSVKDRRNHQNLQLLLQKELRLSDVGNLSRILLPKKDAEKHLPPLDHNCRKVMIAFEDYDTGEKITLRFRYWPNNVTSRIYLLENTGEFVKKHQLQISDRICIYRNQQHFQGTYIIRAWKASDCALVAPICGRRQEAAVVEKEIVPIEVESQETAVIENKSGQQIDLLNFDSLPEASLVDCTDRLVRFPSLGSFDDEMLLLPVILEEGEDASSFLTKDEPLD